MMGQRQDAYRFGLGYKVHTTLHVAANPKGMEGNQSALGRNIVAVHIHGYALPLS